MGDEVLKSVIVDCLYAALGDDGIVEKRYLVRLSWY